MMITLERLIVALFSEAIQCSHRPGLR